MDLESLLERNRRSLTKPDPSLTPREKRAHDQFARDYAAQSRLTRATLSAKSTTETGPGTSTSE
jgi:hypothetical protein